jgi:NADH:ubiquinone oxidoreductase subunit K
MSPAEIVKLDKPVRKVAKPRKPNSLKVKRQVKRKVKVSIFTPRSALIGTTIALLILSLTHLADGIAYLTHCPGWASIAMAIGIDCMFVSVEAILLTADPETKARIKADAIAMTVITIAASSALNGLAFWVTADDSLKYFAGAFGLVIPFLVFGATQILAKLGK